MIKGCKICCIKDSYTLNFIINHPYPPKFVGFICNYPKSSRYVKLSSLKKLLNVKKNKSEFVAILVKPNNEILEEIDTTNLVERKGIIYIWTNKNLKSRNLEIKIRNQLGIKQKLLSQKEILDLEPKLNPVFDGGVIYDYAYHARDPKGITK